METRLAPLISRHRLKLQPFAGAHLGPKIIGPADFGYGTLEQIYLLAGLAALVLLIAAINFVNLAMSRAMTRTLEIGVRKAVGATAPPAFQPIPHRSNCGEPNRHRRWHGPCRSRLADV